MRNYLLAALCVLGLAACGVDPVGDCTSFCNECFGDDESVDCDDLCSDAQSQYDDARAAAEEAGCAAEFDSLYSCGVSTQTCEGTIDCDAEVEAYVDCASATEE